VISAHRGLAAIRGGFRAAGFVAWTLAAGGVLLCIRPFLRERLLAAGGAMTLHLWSRGLCRLLGIRIEVRGVPCRGPSLRVGNHTGYLDVVVLSAVAPAFFVSKDDLAGWPVLGYLGRSVGTLFLNRGRPRAVAETGEAMGKLFARNQSVIVFPEGTSTSGHDPAPFHSALFEPALRVNSGAGVPVQAVALSYDPRYSSDPDDLAAWTGSATFVPHLWRLLCSGGLNASAVFAEPVTNYGDRRAAATGTRNWIAAALSSRRETSSHGPGHGADLVRGGPHRLGSVRHRHRSTRLAEQGQIVGRIADRHSA
jgi:1-acyl-sn-glycerol-3-phosphate acyltransferase